MFNRYLEQVSYQMKRILYYLLPAWTSVHAQPPASAADILLQLQKLEVAGTVLYVAAHPDDENTRLLGFLSNEKKLDVSYLSLTRGEGGQNLIGSEQGEALGVLRSQELLAARRIDGATQYFTRAADFGYSKTPQETFSKWNRDSVLSDIVLVIRRLRPAVIICRFPTTGEGGHGHHTASAMLALEAFDAAADPARFPEQLKHFAPWQCRRIYWNTFNFGGNNTTGPGQYTLEVGGFNPLIGKSYGEIAAHSRSMHKSQGFGSIPQRGPATEYFKLMKGDSAGPDIFDGLDLRLSAFPAFKTASSLVARCINQFDPLDPSASIPALAKVAEALNKVREDDPGILHLKKRKTEALSSLMLACSGLWIDGFTQSAALFPGKPTKVDLHAVNRGSYDLTLASIRSGTTELHGMQVLKAGKSFSATLNMASFDDHDALQQFDHRTAFRAADMNRGPYAGSRTSPPLLDLTLTFSLAGTTFTYPLFPHFRKGDPVKGEVTEPVYLLPPAQAAFEEQVYVLRKGEKKKTRIIVTALSDSVEGKVVLTGPGDPILRSGDTRFSISQKGEEQVIELEIEAGKARRSQISAAVEVEGKAYPHVAKWVSYDHIPKQLLLAESRATVIVPDAEKGINRVAYIPGAGDEVPACLRQMGYEVEILSPDQVNKASLKGMDAVVTGVRAFNVHDRLHEKMNVLLDFVKDGGNLVVQYNTNSRVGPLKFTPGPFPFTISRQRTTDENAPVQFRDSLHHIFSSPNKITGADFEGWIQERGIYYAADADGRYSRPLLMKDPGEEWTDGSILVAKHGRGHYVYTGLAFFRQLPAGVPGAYRLFANLLSLKE